MPDKMTSNRIARLMMILKILLRIKFFFPCKANWQKIATHIYLLLVLHDRLVDQVDQNGGQEGYGQRGQELLNPDGRHGDAQKC